MAHALEFTRKFRPRNLASRFTRWAGRSGRNPPWEERSLDMDESYVLARLDESAVGKSPFYHLFVENVLPRPLYDALRSAMIAHKNGPNIQERHQDSGEYVNQRLNLFESTEPVIDRFRAIFSSPSVKLRLLQKFYDSPSEQLEKSLEIHEEFEFVFTKAGRFQNIHIDIPPKFLSFVFYIPDGPVSPEEEERNATILYGRDLMPRYQARYKENSVCIFAPHFYSYHGFSSTIQRDALVMFYISQAERENWAQARNKDTPPYAGLKDAIEQKLRTYPLLEYRDGEPKLIAEREDCKVNAPKGRVIR